MNKIIMNYGIAIENEQFAALPLHIIDGVICNYTFVKRLDDGICYEGELGKIKEGSMRALGLSFSIIDIATSDFTTMICELAKAHAHFSQKPDLSQVVLYRFEKTQANDAIFYKALNITAQTSIPIIFESLNIKPEQPFFSVPFDKMFGNDNPKLIQN